MEFLKTLCSVSALLSLALLFLPEKPGIKRASYTVFALLLLLFLIPKDGSFSLDRLLSFEEQSESPSGGTYEEVVKGAVADGIKKDIVSRFSLDEAGVTVETDLALTEGGLSGSYLSLSLGKENFFADVSALLRYLKNTYSVDCEVHFLGA